MDEFTSGTPSKPVRSRCQKLRNVILVICAALTLAAFAFVCAVAVVVAAVVHGFGSLLDGLFSGLFASFAALFMTVAASLLLAFPVLMELLALLSTGQVIPFIMRLGQLLGSF
jgi:hypothetical protein